MGNDAKQQLQNSGGLAFDLLKIQSNKSKKWFYYIYNLYNAW